MKRFLNNPSYCINYLTIILFFFLLFYVNPKESFSISICQLDSTFFFQPKDTLDSLRKYYDQIGIDCIVKGDYDFAEINLIKSLRIKEKIFSEYDNRIGNTHLNLGVLYQKLWRFDDALEEFRAAERIYLRIDSQYVDLGSLYVNQAIIYRLLGDYSKAKSYCENAIRIFNSQESIDYSKLQSAVFNLGTILKFSGDLKEAINYYEKSIYYNQTNDSIKILNAFNNVAICYDDLNNNQLAEKFYLSCINIAKSIYGEENPNNAGYIMNYALFCNKQDKHDIGLSLLYVALKMYQEQYGLKHTSTSRCFHNIGLYYQEMHEFETALEYFQNALISAEPSFNDSNISSNPGINNDHYNFRILNTLNSKGFNLLQLYNQNLNLKFLISSLDTYEESVNLIDKVRLKFENEDSRFIISAQYYEVFKNAIIVSSLLYSITKNPIYLQKSFEFNEKSRCFSLLVSLRDVEAKIFGGIPIELLDNEKDLYTKYTFYDELIYDERKKTNPDKIKIDYWEEKLFWIQQDYQKLIKEFESDYPQYYELKYKTDIIHYEEICSKLGVNNNLIEYTYSDSNLFIYFFNSDIALIKEIQIDTSFNTKINFLLSSLSQPNFSADVKQAYKDYTEAAYELYQKLIEPCREFIEGKSLIIIPDGILSYLPFEALLSYKVNPEKIDYRQLPYLLRDYNISYSYSATLHFEDHHRVSHPVKNLLAFAPDYSNSLAQLSTEPSYLENYRENLVPLPGVKDEVGFITKIIDGDLFVDDQATESNFKKKAGDYNILHLAMHTIVDNENPMYSKLAFTQNIDTTEDGFLNTYEIYNMKFNASMAVLSSCKTGFGKLQKGEGVMSLARGFMYAGCPSIIMTLWEVSDKTGAVLMKNFYRHLKQGMIKSEALRQAKLDFILRADQLKAHPYFWSTYVAIGDISPIYDNTRRNYWIIGSAGALILAGMVLFILLRRMKRNRPHSPFRTDKLFS